MNDLAENRTPEINEKSSYKKQSNKVSVMSMLLPLALLCFVFVYTVAINFANIKHDIFLLQEILAYICFAFAVILIVLTPLINKKHKLSVIEKIVYIEMIVAFILMGSFRLFTVMGNGWNTYRVQKNYFFATTQHYILRTGPATITEEGIQLFAEWFAIVPFILIAQVMVTLVCFNVKRNHKNAHFDDKNANQ